MLILTTDSFDDATAAVYRIQGPTFWTPTQPHNIQGFGCHAVNKPVAGSGT